MLLLLWNQRKKKKTIYDTVCVQQWNVFMVWVSEWVDFKLGFFYGTQKIQYPYMYWVWAENQSFSNDNNQPAWGKRSGFVCRKTRKQFGIEVLPPSPPLPPRYRCFLSFFFMLLFLHFTSIVFLSFFMSFIVCLASGFLFDFIGWYFLSRFFLFLIREHVLFFSGMLRCVCVCVSVYVVEKSYSTETLYTCISIKP